MKTFFHVDDVAITDSQFFLIAGPCVIESEAMAREIASETKRIADELQIPYIFKASFDKANRSSIDSFRGPGLKEGLWILGAIKEDFGVPVLSDIHESWQAELAAEVLSIIQIPAFLSRQTDILLAAVKKVEETGNHRVMLGERGTFFGYNNLVVDFRGIPIMKATGCPVVMDASHSVQKPTAAGQVSGGDPEFIPLMARAGIVAGANGLFLEVHPQPDKALSDKGNSFELKKLKSLLLNLKSLYNVG